MISKEAIKRGYNRGNYVVGKHTPRTSRPASRRRRTRRACSAMP
jgi:hypothetical protein